MCFSAQTMGSIGTAGQAIGAAGQVFGAYSSAKAEKDSLKYDSQVAANNAKYAGYQSADALARGRVDETKYRREINAKKGSQIASMAARGLDITEGSALNILSDTDYFGELEALNIRDNAAKEAWGYDVQGSNFTANSQLLKNRSKSIDPMGAAASSLLTGAGNVASSWYKNKAGRTAVGA